MIKSVTVINHLGESLKMELTRPEASAGFYIQRIEGLGPVTANINITERAIGDGASYGSARANSRNIVMYLGFLNSGVNGDIETIRHRSYKYFPLKKRVTIQIETDKRICETYGYVESNEPDIFSNAETTQISIICPDSYFYDISSIDGITAESISYVVPMFEFPDVDPAGTITRNKDGFYNDSLTDSLLTLGELNSDEEYTIVYSGDIEVGIVIHIEPADEIMGDITLCNKTTNEQMVINISKLNTILGEDTGLIAGDEVVITTTRGKKSITLLRDGTSYNIIGCLGGYSDWLQLVPGANVFTFSTNAGSSNHRFRIEYKTAYAGV